MNEKDLIKLRRLIVGCTLLISGDISYALHVYTGSQHLWDIIVLVLSTILIIMSS